MIVLMHTKPVDLCYKHSKDFYQQLREITQMLLFQSELEIIITRKNELLVNVQISDIPSQGGMLHPKAGGGQSCCGH
jgi:hypothetical protein